MQREEISRYYPNHLDLIDSGEIPHDYSTGPDLSYYTESAQFYYGLVVDSSKHFKDKGRPVTDTELITSGIASGRFVEAMWGLIARGVESFPYALKLLRSKDRDHREAAANVFSGFRDPKRLPELLAHVHDALGGETDRLVIDSLIVVLGELRSRNSVRVLARYILDVSEDPGTRDTAANSLGRIVRKRFGKSEAGAVQAASDWLAAHLNNPDESE